MTSNTPNVSGAGRKKQRKYFLIAFRKQLGRVRFRRVAPKDVMLTSYPWAWAKTLKTSSSSTIRSPSSVYSFLSSRINLVLLQSLAILDQPLIQLKPESCGPTAWRAIDRHRKLGIPSLYGPRVYSHVLPYVLPSDDPWRGIIHSATI